MWDYPCIPYKMVLDYLEIDENIIATFNSLSDNLGIEETGF